MTKSFAFALLLFSALSCGGSTGETPSTGGAAGAAGATGGTAGATGGTAGSAADGAAGAPSIACPVCANELFTCSSPNTPESVDFQVESQTATGCAGHILQVGTPTTAYSIVCDPPAVCNGQQCTPATLTSTSFEWGGATCWAKSN